MFSCLGVCVCVCVCILSQSYKAPVFYFLNISFLEHILNKLFRQHESSIS